MDDIIKATIDFIISVSKNGYTQLQGTTNDGYGSEVWLHTASIVLGHRHSKYTCFMFNDSNLEMRYDDIHTFVEYSDPNYFNIIARVLNGESHSC